MKRALPLTVVFMEMISLASADLVRGIDIDFVTIGSPGNPGDARPEANPYGCGAVSYSYRIGKYEIAHYQWNAFTAAAGAPTGDVSGDYTIYSDQYAANNVSWYEAVQFCNYLTSGDKSKGVYLFSGNNANPGDFLGIDRTAARATYGIVYFLPTEDEWYKAAYYKPDGSGYSLYANGLSTIPATGYGWNYYSSHPWTIGSGTQEQNGTYNMMGNVWEWNEAELLVYGALGRGIRGGAFIGTSAEHTLDSFGRYGRNPSHEVHQVGFRVASIPEPITLVLVGLGGLMLRRWRIALPPPL